MRDINKNGRRICEIKVREPLQKMKTCFVVVTKHHIIGTVDIYGEWDFQQANEKENYKQINTYFVLYIYNSQYKNKEKNKLLFTFFLLFFTLESKIINARQ